MAGFDLVARLSLKDDFTSKLGRAEKQMSRMESATKKMSGGLKDFAKNVASIGTAIGITSAISAGFNAVSNSLDGAIDRYDTMQRFIPMMEGLGFSSDVANKSIKALTDGIQGLPTTLPDAVTGTKQIASMTGDLDKATESYLALNNALIASGAEGDAANAAMQQMIKSMASGKMEMDNWTSLMENMPYALKEVAGAFGYTGNRAQMDLFDALKNGNVTMEELIDKFIELNKAQGGFAEIAKTASGGIKNAWGNMQNAITAGLAGTIEAIDKALGGTGSLEAGVEKMKVGIQKAFKVVNGAIEPTFKLLKPVADLFGDIYSAIENVQIAAQNGSELGVLTALGIDPAKAAEILHTIDDVMNRLRDFGTNVQQSLQPLRNVVTEIVDYFKTKWQELQPTIETLKSAFGSIGNAVTPVFQTLWAVVQPILSGLWTAIKIVGDIVVMVFNNVVAPMLNYAMELFKGLWAVVGPILELLGLAIEAAFGVLKGIWDNVLKPVVSWLLTKFKQAIETSTKALQPITNAFETLGDKISGVVDWLKNVAEWFKNIKVPDWVFGLGGKVASFVGSGVNRLAGGGTANSHYHGLDSVPYDGYNARLHKGEAVITAQENKERKQGGAATVTFGDIHLHGVGGDMRKAADELMSIMVSKVQAAGGAGA